MGFEVNTGYAKSIPGILRIVEFALLLVAWACVAHCCGDAGGRIAFFLFVTIFGWICVGALFLLFLLKFEGKISGVNWNIFHMVFGAVMAVLLLVSASLVADTAARWKRLYDYYTQFHGLYYTYATLYDNLVAGAVFAFLALIVFVVDVFIHFKQRNSGQETDGEAKS